MIDTMGLGSVRFRFESDLLSEHSVHVQRCDAVERLDEPYRLEVDILIDTPDVDVIELLGRNCTLTIERAPLERRFTGLVRTVWEGQHDPNGTRARLLVCPALFMLSRRRDSRIFQHRTVPDILEEVLSVALADYDREVELDLEASYPEREHCLQYQESDLEFVHRLMEEEGISYAFDHSGDVERLILRDTNARYPRVDSATDPIELQPHDLQSRDREVVHRFERRHAHTTTSVVVRDFDWTTAEIPFFDEARAEDSLGRDRESYEHGLGRSSTLSEYRAGSRRYEARDPDRQAELRREAYALDDLVAEGHGRVIGFAPGVVFELVGHPTLGVDGEYLVTAVRHTDRPMPIEGTDDESGRSEVYHNSFECIPLAVPHRPRRRTPKPSIPGVQTAIVTGPAGEEIHTDEHGRIKVQFHWDRDGASDEKSSCWVRCEHAWAGPGWGHFWLPRIGMEVVVHFVDGDPDRPMVTGCVYNGANPLPYSLPDEKTKSTIKSNSSPGGGGFNEFRFEDQAGQEQIYVHAQRDYNEVVLNDHTTKVHHDQTIEVDGHQLQTVDNDQSETVHQHQELSVGGDREVHVDGDFEESIDGTETRLVTGDVTETFDANEVRSIGASLTEQIGGDETRTVGSSQDETIGGSHTLTIAGSSTRTIAGTLTQSVVGGITTTTPAAYNITAVAGMTVTAAGGITMVAPGGVKLVAPGGVKWVDNSDAWFGSELVSVSGISEPSVTTLDMTLGGISLSLAGKKNEFAAFTVKNRGKGRKLSGVRIVAKGMYAFGGGLRKATKAIIAKI